MIVLEAFDKSASTEVYANIPGGTSVLSGGKSASVAAPNGMSQERLTRQALKVSSIGLDEVDYIKAHGTGTALRDPIEMEARADVLATSESESERDCCWWDLWRTASDVLRWWRAWQV